jgi:hypothetical protein
MGSQSGKYKVEHENSTPNDIKASSSNSSDSVASDILIQEEASLPTCIHQNVLIDTLPFDMDCVTLVWLDTEINNRPSNIDIQIKLKNLINYIRIFDRVDECQQYIEQIGIMNNTENVIQEKLLVIVSPALASTIIPHLHEVSQIKYFYIYETSKTNVKINQQLLKEYTKVCSSLCYPCH